jgi:hypothetical protein
MSLLTERKRGTVSTKKSPEMLKNTVPVPRKRRACQLGIRKYVRWGNSFSQRVGAMPTTATKGESFIVFYKFQGIIAWIP